MIRTGARGYADGTGVAFPELVSSASIFLTSPCLGLFGGGVIGLPPVLNFGSPELKAKVSYVSLSSSLSTHVFRSFRKCFQLRSSSVLPFRRRTQEAMYWE